jgi:hypothetical protein
MKLPAPHLLACFALFVGAGCSSHLDSVCQDIGDCSQGGSTTWIASCQTEGQDLQTEAMSVACASDLDAYWSCADSSYSCRGATAVFPGCAEDLTALDSCLAAATAKTSCVRLEMEEAGCAAPRPDAGTALGTPPACTAARDCQARCYLASVRDVCAPQVDELQSFAACAAACPL